MGTEQLLPDWLQTPGAAKLLRAAIGLLVIWLVVRLLQRTTTRHVDATDTRYRLRKLVALLGWVAAGVLLAGIFSDRFGQLTVAFGVAGAGIAFALQEVIASFAGWIAISMGGFYNPGDRVQLGGIKGDVIDIGVLRTTLMECGNWVAGDLYNGRIVRVANSFVFKEPVFNYSADFPFLWDEITVPVRYGSDHRLARRIVQQAVTDVVGDYTGYAKAAWAEMVRKYRIEDASVEPMITMVANDNWIEFTARYVVDYKRRRGTKDKIFSTILDQVEATKGAVQLASATYELTAGNLSVRLSDGRA
jgi:small-conductance mechanosensitive channel